MTIDTTVTALPLNEDVAREIIQKIMDIPIDDGISFQITSCKEIMSDFDYPGIRLIVEARLDKLRQSIKIDISTDDVITPRAVEYSYKLMFEDRTISVMSYNLETLMAEKLQTILVRDIANTRMRDFYDIYFLSKEKEEELKTGNLLHKAFLATCEKRETVYQNEDIHKIYERILHDEVIKDRWELFCRDNYFVGKMEWDDVIRQVGKVFEWIDK